MGVIGRAWTRVDARARMRDAREAVDGDEGK